MATSHPNSLPCAPRPELFVSATPSIAIPQHVMCGPSSLSSTRSSREVQTPAWKRRICVAPLGENEEHAAKRPEVTMRELGLRTLRLGVARRSENNAGRLRSTWATA